MNKTSVLLAAAALAGPAFAQGTDDCVAPTAIGATGAYAFDTTVATTSGFAGAAAACDTAMNQDLFWVFTSPVAGTLQFDTEGSTFDTQLSIFDGADCSATCLANNDDGGTGLLSLITLGGVNVGDVFLIQVAGFGAGSGFGSLNIDVPPPSICDTPDALETNTDCASATAIGDGTYTMLNVSDIDNDYYAITVPNGGTLTADILFLNSGGDVDIYLWDPTVDCDTQVVGTGTGTYLVRGFSASDDESIVYDNLSGADQNLIIEVDMFTTGGCNTYDLIVSGAGMGDGGIGSAYCMANVNSTGVIGEMLVTGSNVVANNDVTLNATSLPANAFGFFITSLQQNFVMNPGGSAGNLCLGGAIGRYVGAGQIMNSGAAGEISLTIDLTMIPSPTGFVSAAAGDNWNYQLWYRDTSPMGATSNFTNGYSVDYN